MSEESAIESCVRPYLPSNGSEGMDFMARFCDRCVREAGEGQCEILNAAFMADPGKGPREWVEETAKPYRAWCTAFDPTDEGVRAQWEAAKANLPSMDFKRIQEQSA